MVGESNQNVFLIPIDASNFAEFEISEFEISRFDCTFADPDQRNRSYSEFSITNILLNIKVDHVS